MSAIEKLDDVKLAVAAVKSLFSQNEKKSMERHVIEEMTIIIEAYGKVASKRIIDEIPGTIWTMLKDIIPKLKLKLDEVSDDHLSQLIQEKPATKRTRANVMDEISKMEIARKSLMEMQII